MVEQTENVDSRTLFLPDSLLLTLRILPVLYNTSTTELYYHTLCDIADSKLKGFIHAKSIYVFMYLFANLMLDRDRGSQSRLA